MVYTYQHCWRAYRYPSRDNVQTAKRDYYDMVRLFAFGEDVLRTCKSTKWMLKVCGITLRLAKSSAMQKGLPLCGNNRDSLGYRPISLGVLE